MRQVPENQSKALLIGNGKLAKHLDFYFSSLNISFARWYRQQNKTSLADLAKNSTHIYFAISDSAIESFYLSNKDLFQGKTLVHFSGSLEVSDIHSVHPMMSFGENLYPIEKYNSIAFNTFDVRYTLNQLVPGIQNKAYFIPKEKKGQYHAYCALVGNLPQLLWGESLSFWDEMNIPIQELRNFVVQSFDNIIHSRKDGITGPIKRNDETSIQKNIKDLNQDRLSYIYTVFAEQFSKTGNNYENH